MSSPACRKCFDAGRSDNISDVERDVPDASAPGVDNNSDKERSDNVSDVEKDVSDASAPGVGNREEDSAVESDPMEPCQDHAPAIASENNMNIDIGWRKIDFNGYTKQRNDPLGGTVADQASNDIPRGISLPPLEALVIKCAPQSSVAGLSKELPLEIDSESHEALAIASPKGEIFGRGCGNPTPQSDSNKIPKDSEPLTGRDSPHASPKPRSKPVLPPRTNPNSEAPGESDFNSPVKESTEQVIVIDPRKQDPHPYGVTADTEQSPSSTNNVKHLKLSYQVDPITPPLSATTVPCSESPGETRHTARTSSHRMVRSPGEDESTRQPGEPPGKDSRPARETLEEGSVSSMKETQLTTDTAAVICHDASVVVATGLDFDKVSPSEIDQVTRPCSKNDVPPCTQKGEEIWIPQVFNQDAPYASDNAKAKESSLTGLPHVTMDPSSAPGAVHVTPSGHHNDSSSERTFNYTVDEIVADETAHQTQVTADQENLPQLEAVVIDEDFERRKINEAAQKLMAEATVTNEGARRRIEKKKAMLCFFIGLLATVFSSIGVVVKQRATSPNPSPEVSIEDLDRLEYLRDVLSRNFVEHVEYLPFDTQDNSTTIPERVFAWLVDHDPLDWRAMGESREQRIVRRYAIVSTLSRLLGRFPSEIVRHNDDECDWTDMTDCVGDKVVTFTCTQPVVIATLLPELGLLKGLTALYLTYCNLTQFPPSIASLSNLKSVGLRGNSMPNFPWESLSKMSHLESLYLNRNMLSGSLPSGIGEWWPQMREFYVSGNENLRGNLPQSMSLWSELRVLNVAKTSLSGPLPANTKWSSMVGFYASDANFSGFLPEEIGDWSSLEFFDVGTNSFSGTIPESIINATGLQKVRVDNNDFMGTMPFCSNTSNLIPKITADCQEVVCECCSTCCHVEYNGVDASVFCNELLD